MYDDFKTPNATSLYELTHPRHAAAVTPSNDTDLANAGLLYVGTGNNTLKVTTIGGDTVTFNDVPNGTILPVVVKRVFATGTDAVEMLVLY